MPKSTWDDRELPILTALVEMFDAGGSYIEPAEIAEKTGLDEPVVQLGLRALMHADPEYINVRDVSGYGQQTVGFVNYVTGAARPAVGTWPTPDDRAAEIIAAIEKVAERAPDEETRGRLLRVVAYLGGAGKDLLVQVAAAALAKGTGLG